MLNEKRSPRDRKMAHFSSWLSLNLD